MSLKKFAEHVARKLGKLESKEHKFSAKRTNGFASGLESDVHAMLLLRVKAKELSDLRCQHAVFLSDAQIRTKIDFSAKEIATASTIFFEAKGAETERWLILKKLWKSYGPGVLQIWKSNHRGIYLAETITPEREA